MVNKTNIFIGKAKIKHGDKYDYSLVNYLGAKIKIKIICSIHGIFEQRPTNHLSGSGCLHCGGSILTTLEIFINESNLKHDNKYSYPLVNYINNNTKIKIICPIHDVFEQRPNDHLQGKGCPQCGLNERIKKRADTLYNFIKKANYKHNNLYKYSKSLYTNAITKLIIICSKHGEFKQTPTNHLAGKGCPICNESHGEREIRQFLEQNNINFIQQYKFKDCKYKKQLPFDFYLPNYNICIEFNGRQHYEPVSHFGGLQALEETKKRDKIKMEYCQNNNIPLIIIKNNEKIDGKIIFNLRKLCW